MFLKEYLHQPWFQNFIKIASYEDISLQIFAYNCYNNKDILTKPSIESFCVCVCVKYYGINGNAEIDNESKF